MLGEARQQKREAAGRIASVRKQRGLPAGAHPLLHPRVHTHSMVPTPVRVGLLSPVNLETPSSTCPDDSRSYQTDD